MNIKVHCSNFIGCIYSNNVIPHFFMFNNILPNFLYSNSKCLNSIFKLLLIKISFLCYCNNISDCGTGSSINTMSILVIKIYVSICLPYSSNLLTMWKKFSSWFSINYVLQSALYTLVDCFSVKLIVWIYLCLFKLFATTLLTI